MKLVTVLFTGCLLSVSAFARPGDDAGRGDRLVEKAQEVTRSIQARNSNLSQSDRRAIAQHLDAIREILRNGNGSSYPTPPPPPYPGNGSGYDDAYICVSRDNDGAAPYVMAVRQGLNVVRMRATFNSTSACSSAINSMRYVGNKKMMCLSRDNDGSEPYQLVSISGTDVTAIPRTVSSFSNCNNLLNSLRPDRRNTVVFCTSRDNDGAAPYVAMSLSLYDNSTQVGTEVFSSMSSCQAFIQ